VVIVTACVYLALVALALWRLFVSEDRGELFLASGLIGVFGACAGFCVVEYFLTRGTYDNEVIDFYTPWTGRKIERWSDLCGAELYVPADWYVLTFRSGNKIRISSMLSDSRGVLAVLDQRKEPFLA